MKGLEFVAVDPGIAKDPKVALMAERLRRDRFWVAGHFPAFFGEVAMHAQDGNIGTIPNDLLDQWAGGVRGWGALVKELLCEEGLLTAWHRYNGRAIERLVEDRQRKADYRRNVRGKSKDCPQTNPGLVRGQSGHNTDTGTETDTETEKNDQQIFFSASAERFVEQCPEHYRPSVAAAFRAHGKPTVLLSSLEALVSGLHPPAYPHAIIAQAIEEMAVAGIPMAVNVLRGFCRKLAEPARPERRTEATADAWDAALQKLVDAEATRAA